MNSNRRLVAIIGAGYMGEAYGQVLENLGEDFRIYSKSGTPRTKWMSSQVLEPYSKLGARSGDITHAVIAVPVEDLVSVCVEVIGLGLKSILLEKPGFLNWTGYAELREASKTHGSEIFVALNRRFYPSVQFLKQAIDEDGGLTSFHFEFSEGGVDTDLASFPKKVKQRWLLANSSHVLDLVSYVGGEIDTTVRFSAGSVDWHPSGGFFAGFGTFKSGVPFTYRSDLAGRDRWSITGYTRKRTVRLQPLEIALERSEFRSEFRPVDLGLPLGLKPGVKDMVLSFLDGSHDGLARIEDQWRLLRWVSYIADYDTLRYQERL